MVKPKLKINFTNGLPKDLGGQGFETTIEGSYDKCIALMEAMTSAMKDMKGIDDARPKK